MEKYSFYYFIASIINYIFPVDSLRKNTQHTAHTRAHCGNQTVQWQQKKGNKRGAKKGITGKSINNLMSLLCSKTLFLCFYSIIDTKT